MWWIPFALVAALCAGGLITKLFKDQRFRTEMEDLVLAILQGFKDGKLTVDEIARIVSESKDVYQVIVEINKEELQKKKTEGS